MTPTKRRFFALHRRTALIISAVLIICLCQLYLFYMQFSSSTDTAMGFVASSSAVEIASAATDATALTASSLGTSDSLARFFDARHYPAPCVWTCIAHRAVAIRVLPDEICRAGLPCLFAPSDLSTKTSSSKRFHPLANISSRCITSVYGPALVCPLPSFPNCNNKGIEPWTLQVRIPVRSLATHPREIAVDRIAQPTLDAAFSNHPSKSPGKENHGLQPDANPNPAPLNEWEKEAARLFITDNSNPRHPPQKHDLGHDDTAKARVSFYRKWTSEYTLIRFAKTRPFQVYSAVADVHTGYVAVNSYYLPYSSSPAKCDLLYCIYQFPDGTIEEQVAIPALLTVALCPYPMRWLPDSPSKSVTRSVLAHLKDDQLHYSPENTSLPLLHLTFDHQLFSIPFRFDVVIPHAMNDEQHLPVAATLCTMAYQAGQYIRPWIEYHQMLGFERIVIYDNNPIAFVDQKLEALLQNPKYQPPYVHRIPWPHRSTIANAANDCNIRFGLYTKWMSFIEVDQYIVPQGNITNLVEDLETSFPDSKSIHVPSTLFGPCSLTTNFTISTNQGSNTTDNSSAKSHRKQKRLRKHRKRKAGTDKNVINTNQTVIDTAGAEKNSTKNDQGVHAGADEKGAMNQIPHLNGPERDNPDDKDLKLANKIQLDNHVDGNNVDLNPNNGAKKGIDRGFVQKMNQRKLLHFEGPIEQNQQAVDAEPTPLSDLSEPSQDSLVVECCRRTTRIKGTRNSHKVIFQPKYVVGYVEDDVTHIRLREEMGLDRSHESHSSKGDRHYVIHHYRFYDYQSFIARHAWSPETIQERRYREDPKRLWVNARSNMHEQRDDENMILRFIPQLRKRLEVPLDR